MSAPAQIPALVRRIVPSLGSSVDGEALGACRAIGRTLTAARLDFHDLARAISAGEERENTATRANRPKWDAEGWRAARRRRIYAFTEAQTAEHRRMALWVRNNEAGRLSVGEREFVADISHQRRELTIPQADRLAALTERLVMETRAC